jgi:hypothetical protein
MASFTNHRLSTLPAERMRAKCLVADDFVSEGLALENNAVKTGSPTFDRGVTTSSGNYVTYNDVPAITDGKFSVVIKFNTTDTSGSLFSNRTEVGTSGVYRGLFIDIQTPNVTVGITADSSNTSYIYFEIDVFDGEDHTLTLSADSNTNDVSIFVDDQVQEYTKATNFDIISEVVIGKSIIRSLDGKVYYFKVFNEVFTQSDHDYYLSNHKSFTGSPLAVWRMDEICNDTNGNKIWDKQPTLRDLYRADGETPASFPSFEGDSYLFDYIDDYISNFPALTEAYTISASTNAETDTIPVVEQYNDRTLLDKIETAGGFLGLIYNMLFFGYALSEIQKKDIEFSQLANLDRGPVKGIFSRLAIEGTGKACLVLNESYRNFGSALGFSSPNNVTESVDGVEFASNDSRVTLDDDTEYRLTNGTVIINGDFDIVHASAGVLVDKLNNYILSTDSDTIVLNLSEIEWTFNNNTQLGVVFVYGKSPRFFIDGNFIGEGDISISPDSSYTSNVSIGNTLAGSSQTPYKLNQVYIGDEPLTDSEMLSMYENSRTIAANPGFDKFIIQETAGAELAIQETAGADLVIQEVSS